jgi:hypothetical protein
MSPGWRLAHVLRDPGTALGFAAREWTELFAVARAEQMARIC